MLIPAIAPNVPVDPAAVGASQPPGSGSIDGFVHSLTIRGSGPRRMAVPRNVSPMVAYGRRAEMRNPTSRRPTRPEITIALSGLVLAGLSFVPWWGSIATESVTLGNVGRLPGATGRFNAYFGYGWTLELAILLGLVMSVLALSRSFAKLDPPRWLYFWIGAAMTVLAFASLMRGPIDSGFAGVAGVEVSRGPLIFLAPFVCALGALAGIGYGRIRRGKRKRGSPKPG
jgi:hypothetical protein